MAFFFLVAFTFFCTMASKVTGTALRVVYVTVPNRELANKIARSVVSEKLAACVNIVPGITSVYNWEGKLNEDEELLLIMKTQESAILSLQEAVKKLHTYDVPEFVSLPVDHASEPYRKWIEDQTLRSE